MPAFSRSYSSYLPLKQDRNHRLLFLIAIACMLFFTVTAEPALARTSTQITMDVSSHSPTWPQPVTLTATVKTNGNPVTLGEVLFCSSSSSYCEDSTLLGRAQLKADGTAALKLLLPIGTHYVYAQFRGTTALSPSSSLSTPQIVDVEGSYQSTTDISAAGNIGDYTLSSTVTGMGVNPPTGNLAFDDALNRGLIWRTVIMDRSTATFGFANSSSYLVAKNHEPWDVAVGDMNDDGIPDLVTVDTDDPGTVAILLGDPAHPGHFLPPHLFQTGKGYPSNDDQPESIALGDFNHDGLLDIAVADSDGTAQASTPTQVSVLLNDPKQPGVSFQPYAEYAAGFQPMAIVAEDFNGDGILDLLVANYGNLVGTPSLHAAINLLPGDPKNPGHFLAPIQTEFPGYAIMGATSLISRDFNQDGLPDLVVIEDNSSSVTTSPGAVFVLLNSASNPGSFQAPQTYDFGPSPQTLLSADFNHDGLPDLGVVGYISANDFTFTLKVMLADPAHPGQFLPISTYPMGNIQFGFPVTIGDFNADGFVDVVSSGFNTVEVLYGDSANPGKFLPNVSIPTPLSLNSRFLTSADLNGDGVSDIVAPDVTFEYTPDPVAVGSAFVLLSGMSQKATANHVSIGPGVQYIYASYSGMYDLFGSNSCAIGLPQETPSGPTISNVAVTDITRNSVTVTWTSNVPTNGVVDYGTTSALGSSTQWVNTPRTYHAISLTGLAPGTTYNYKVRSVSFFNGCTHWTTFSSPGSFTTLP